MAFFDKLKDKVNKVVDVNKLGEMANKVKNEVAKAVDPSIREQERIEKERKEQIERERIEKELQEQKEQERRAKENAVNDFLSSVDLDKELDYIFSVLENSQVTAHNFEKGVEHLLSKSETTVTMGDVLPALKKVLFARAFTDSQCTAAKVVATDYFMSDIVERGLLSLYISFDTSRAGGSFAVMEEPFIKALFGVAGRVVNYKSKGLNGERYQSMAPDDFISVIEESDVLKSYTDTDPFAADEKRRSWTEKLYRAPLELVSSSRLNSLLNDEEYVDMLYYNTYIVLRSGQEASAESVSVAGVANAYLEYLKEFYSRYKK